MEFMKSVVYLCFIGLMLCFPLHAAANGPTNFTLTSTDGEQVELSDFDGKRKLAVFFLQRGVKYAKKKLQNLR